MKNKKILIASVLKPVDDVRHYHKIGKSLSEIGYFIHILAHKSSDIKDEKNIKFHPVFKFKRLGLKRLFAPIVFLYKAIRIKPQVAIICTHELLPECFWLKILCGTKIIYDVQENYALNALHSGNFSSPIKYVAWLIIKIRESFSRLYVDYYFLAERIYAEQIPMVKKRFLLLENKYLRNKNEDVQNREKNKNTFIISGTISESYGIYEAIAFFEKLRKTNNAYQLTVIGQCRDEKVMKFLSSHKHLKLMVSTEAVEHQKIIEEINKADFALLPYQTNSSTYGRIPTKFYEYMHHKIPMVIQKNEFWKEFLKDKNVAIFIDFKTENPSLVLQNLNTFNFYANGVSEEIYWESEKKKLLQFASDVF